MDQWSGCGLMSPGYSILLISNHTIAPGQSLWISYIPPWNRICFTLCCLKCVKCFDFPKFKWFCIPACEKRELYYETSISCVNRCEIGIRKLTSRNLVMQKMCLPVAGRLHPLQPYLLKAGTGSKTTITTKIFKDALNYSLIKHPPQKKPLQHFLPINPGIFTERQLICYVGTWNELWWVYH